ncbi:putative Fe-S protein YdhL (DUF1289 family) [Nakamurella sp. UYEF19]
MVRPTLSVVSVPGGVAVADPVVSDPQQAIDPISLSSRVSADRMVIETNDDALLAPLIGDSEWTVRAVCAGTDPDALFVTGAAQRDAAKLCQGCPVRLECLADALDNRIEYGVWGGMTERQRRAVLKKSPEVTSWRSMLEEARASSTEEAAS